MGFGPRALFAVAALAISLAGCSDGGGSAASVQDEQEPSPLDTTLVEGESTEYLNDECAAFAARLRAARAPRSGGRATAIEELDIPARGRELRDLADAAPPELRDEVDTVADAMAQFEVPYAGFEDDLERLERSAQSGDAEAIREFDELTDQFAETMNEFMGALASVVVPVADACGLRVLESADPEEVARLHAPSGELAPLATYGLVGPICIYGNCDSRTGGFAGLVGEATQSGMDEEAQDCWDDLDAYEVGDNPGCDALYEACADGDGLACNDLDENASDGSEYAEFALTCGGRDSSPDHVFQSACEWITQE